MSATRIFFDMDGTLAQFHNEPNWRKRMGDENFYKNLAPYTNLLKAASLLASKEDAEVYVLSAYINSPFCVTEKNTWLDANLSSIPSQRRILVPEGTDKAAHIENLFRTALSVEDVLVDDYTVNLLDWKRKGGRGIKFLNGINGKNLIPPAWDGEVVHYDFNPLEIIRKLSNPLIS